MKVKEVIEKLQECNPEDDVQLENLGIVEYIKPIKKGGKVLICSYELRAICPECGNELLYDDNCYYDDLEYDCPNCDNCFSKRDLW